MSGVLLERLLAKLSLALATVRRAEQEEAATIQEYNQKKTAEPQNFGTLGDMLKKKAEKK